MKINIRGQKLEITNAIQNHIEKKLEKLEKYFSKPEEVIINVLVSVKGIDQSIEVTIPRGKITLRAEEKRSDLYAAVDYVIDKIESQIRKNKTKLKKGTGINELPEFNFDYETTENIEETEFGNVVKRKKIELKPMNEEEAILQMELLNHDFFLFKNEDQDCFSVIYRRKDGQYGIIDTN